MVTFTRMSDGQPLPASKINELQQELEILSNGTASLLIVRANTTFPSTFGTPTTYVVLYPRLEVRAV